MKLRKALPDWRVRIGEQLVEVAEYLLANETMSGEEFEKVFDPEVPEV